MADLPNHSIVVGSTFDLTDSRTRRSTSDLRCGRSLVLAVLLQCAALFAMAQTVVKLDPPELKHIDRVGVNLVSGLPQFSVGGAHIGPKSRPLSHSLSFSGFAPDNFEYSDLQRGVVHVPGGPWTICPDGTECPNILVRIGGSAERFYLSNGTYGTFHANGATLIKNADGSYTYTRRDGTLFRASPNVRSAWCIGLTGDCAGIVEVRFPDGLTSNITYESAAYAGLTFYRPLAIQRNDGYQLRYQYAPGSNSSASSYFAATSPTGVIALNTAVEYCDPAALSCSLSLTWPTASYSFVPIDSSQSAFTVIDAGGQTTRYTNSTFGDFNTRVIAVKSASSSSSDTAVYAYSDYTVCAVAGSTWDCSALRPKLVSSISIGAGTWNYNFYRPPVPYNNIWEASGVGPEGFNTYAKTYSYSNGLTYISDATSGGTTGTYTYDMPNRLSTLRDQDGRSFALQYDSRGNVTEKRQVASSGSGLADQVQSAGYDAACTYPAKCNKPNWVKDANGNQTDFEYDPAHGGVLKETLPADSNGVRPQKRYSYVQRYAWLKDAAGSYTRAATPIWLQSQVSACRTGAASATGVGCALGAADEVITTYEYGPDSGPNNLLLRGQVVTATDGSVSTSLRTCYSYDRRGNKISETTPRSGLTSCP